MSVIILPLYYAKARHAEAEEIYWHAALAVDIHGLIPSRPTIRPDHILYCHIAERCRHTFAAPRIIFY